MERRNSAYALQNRKTRLKVYCYYHLSAITIHNSFPVAQMVEHGASNAKIMGSIPRESKSW